MLTTIKEFVTGAIVRRVFTKQNLLQPSTISGIVIAVLTLFRVQVTPEMTAQVGDLVAKVCDALTAAIAAYAVFRNEKKPLPWLDGKQP